MSTEVYLAREMRFTKAIKVLRIKKYIIITKCAIAFNLLSRTLNNR